MVSHRIQVIKYSIGYIMRYLIIFLTTFLFSNSISNYKPIFECIYFNSKEYVAIRSLKFNGTKALLIADTDSLNTELIEKDRIENRACSSKILNSRYVRLLNSIKSSNHPLQNDGIVSSSQGIVITTDLCPSSKKGFEDRLYLALIKKFQNPVPVTLFITKRWILKHKKEFNQLKEWNKEGNLTITWGNHTAKHIYHPKAKLEHNFVLSPEENLTNDILDLEVTLLKSGIVPSIFFRFPGLVSNSQTIKLVTNMGLITIGTNCWIAKGQKIKRDSIILLHGNRNEPQGVELFLNYLKESNLTKPIDIKMINSNSNQINSNNR